MLDTESLRQHQQTSKASSYIVDASGQNEVATDVAKKLLQETGISVDSVNSFIMKASELESTLQTAMTPQQITIS